MAGIGGFFKGLKAAFGSGKTAFTSNGRVAKGLYKNSKGTVKAKPGYSLTNSSKGKLGAKKEAGFLNKIKRNPKTTLALGATALGGAYLYGSSDGTGQTIQGYA